MSKSPEIAPKEVSQLECEKTERLLGWETGAVRSLEHSLELCDEVETCELDCECRLRDAYHFYQNESLKEYKID
jgi:hypothetical protein